MFLQLYYIRELRKKKQQLLHSRVLISISQTEPTLDIRVRFRIEKKLHTWIQTARYTSPIRTN